MLQYCALRIWRKFGTYKDARWDVALRSGRGLPYKFRGQFELNEIQKGLAAKM